MTKRKENPKKRGNKPKDPAQVLHGHTVRFTDQDWADIEAQGGAAYLRRLHQEDKARRTQKEERTK